MKTHKLKGKLAETGYTQSVLSNELGMSKNALNQKINGKLSFKLDEIVKLCELLKLSNDEKIDIFLN